MAYNYFNTSDNRVRTSLGNNIKWFYSKGHRDGEVGTWLLVYLVREKLIKYGATGFQVKNVYIQYMPCGYGAKRNR